MPRVILFNKPYGVLCQFTDTAGRRTLKDYIDIPNVYAAGRLDADSEGLVVLTDDGVLQARLADPKHKQPKTYWVQVEGSPDDAALEPLRRGVRLNDGPTRPAAARCIREPAGLWPRDPPIRARRNIPTAWVELRLTEGRNRQVRRMTAAIGLPALRLVRYSVGHWHLDSLPPGRWRDVAADRQ